MSNIIIFLLIAATAVMITARLRTQRDRTLLASEVERRGGTLIRLERVKKGSPFPDTTRGWWAWRVYWKDETAERASWVLTSREGLREWRE